MQSCRIPIKINEPHNLIENNCVYGDSTQDLENWVIWNLQHLEHFFVLVKCPLFAVIGAIFTRIFSNICIHKLP